MKGPAFWLLIGIIAVIFFLIGKGCSSPSVVTNQRYVDSLIIDNGLKSAKLAYFLDSAELAKREQDRRTSIWVEQLAQSREDARKSQQNASYWAGQFKTAKEKRDTVIQLAACDSLAEEVHIAYATIEQERRAADSVITAQQKRIELGDKLRDKLRDRITEQDSVISKLYKASTDANALVKKMDKKQRRAKFWGGVKTAGAAVAGFFIGYKVVK